MASLFFILIYLHMFRGTYYSSYKFKNTWVTGVRLLILLILTAFVGYVLPWGQMSFWAATVITKFLSAIPFFGHTLLIWVWGGLSVGPQVLKFFFSLHFVLPILMLFIIILHFIALHFKGSSSKIIISPLPLKVKFTPFFLYKDFINFVLIVGPFIIFNLWLTRESQNFIMANPSANPLHIKPEWYFLFAYAILRSIPHKLSGVIIIGLSVILFYTFILIIKIFISKSPVMTPNLVLPFLLLTWVGYNEAVDLFVILGQLSSIYYLMLILIFPPISTIQKIVFF